MYLPGLSLLWDELEIVIATSSRATIGLMRTGLCITTFSARIAAACSGVGGPASRSLRNGCMTGLLPTQAVRTQDFGAGGIGNAMSVAMRHPSDVWTHSRIIRNGLG